MSAMDFGSVRTGPSCLGPGKVLPNAEQRVVEEWMPHLRLAMTGKEEKDAPQR